MSTITEAGVERLECTYCGKTYADTEQQMRLSPCCEKPLYARYDLDRIAADFQPERLAGRAPTMWRYAEVLPVHDPAFRLSLGEGFTPMLDAPRLAAALGVRKVWVKDEGQNPTGSFKARGLGMAVARSAEQGVKELCIPSAGNAGSAAAAYAAAADLPVHIAVPEDTPRPIVQEIRALGADLQLVKGLITDAGAVIAEGAREHGWFDLSTLKEPYRVEGKKTMGYEVFEQLGNRLPDVIVYPTGGGTGMVGMWKAFDEMERMGWIGSERPRMVSVQGTGCAPIVRAWKTPTRWRRASRSRAPSGTSSSCAPSANRAALPWPWPTTPWWQPSLCWAARPACSRRRRVVPPRRPSRPCWNRGTCNRRMRWCSSTRAAA
jgi:threonine synthase